MADSGTKNFGSILSGGLYRIPNYQRGYAWTSKEVNDLIDDLEYVTDNESIGDHYLNSVIVAEKQGETSAEISDVIDGQQRLLTASLLANEILRKAFELCTNDNQNIGQLRQNIEDKLYNDVFKRSPSRIQYRILPAEEHQDVFEQLIPENLEEERNLDAIETEADSPSEQKFVEAVDAISERLDGIMNTSENETIPEKLMYLDRLASTLHKDFTATLHEVNSPSEAGRIFEAINDRGRDLNRADKIKSYLVYRASLPDVDTRVEDIHESFTRVYEKLNEYASGPAEVDDLIDKLISQHWTIFAGEERIRSSDDLIGRHENANKNIEQIKRARYHIPKEADGSRVEKWIDVYLESLQEAANAYVRVRGAGQESVFEQITEKSADGADASAIRHSLYAIEEFGPSTTDSFSVSLSLRFAGAEVYERIVRNLEKLVIRIFGVGGARRSTKRRPLESLSRTLFWSNRHDLSEVFPEESSILEGIKADIDKYGIEGDVRDSDLLIDMLKEWAYEYTHETENGEEVDTFERRLKEDPLNGREVAKWGGLFENELTNYMLYHYEASIRSGGAELPKYLEAGINNYTIEHVWPDTRSGMDIASDLDDDEYAHYVERLGNLAFLSLSENSTAGNHDYETKWERTYEDASDGTKMVRDEFPDPTSQRSNKASEAGFSTWGTDVVEWRSERMAATLADYWSVS